MLRKHRQSDSFFFFLEDEFAVNKNSTEAESTIIAENFAKWALDEDTALPDTSNGNYSSHDI